MADFNIANGGHQFEKINLVTRHNRNGFYDLYKCKFCGLEGKSYHIGIIRIPNRYAEKARLCRKRPIFKKIKIISFNGYSEEFENITPGSVHEIIPPPEGYDNKDGEWVMGKTEPVLILFREFKYIQ